MKSQIFHWALFTYNMNFLTMFRLEFFMLFQMEEHLKLN